MLQIIDDTNSSNLSSSAILVRFDIINMLRKIDNNMSILSARTYLDERQFKDTPTDCEIEALELCLSCNNSIFNNNNFLHTDGKAQGPHMSYSHPATTLIKLWLIMTEKH